MTGPNNAGARTRFLSLKAADQRDAYLIASEELGKSATILEKDVWVCWTLDALFTCQGLPKMAFKGGTSLSKVFSAIDRFSEDIDVTMDCRDLSSDIQPFGEQVSRKQRGRDDQTLRAQMLARSKDLVVPHLRSQLEQVGLGSDALQIQNDGEVLVVNYPHVVDSRHVYYREGVKIEFGGRNMTEPNEVHTLVPYTAAALDGLEFTAATVPVLSPSRTFWEKFTLAHAESNRVVFKNADRLSRHWHDLAVLSEHQIGRAALDDLDLLADVVKVKTRFYNSATAQYDLCLQGHSNLLPDEDGLNLLRADYEAMIAAGMLEAPICFAEIIDRVRALQDEANRRAKDSRGAGIHLGRHLS